MRGLGVVDALSRNTTGCPSIFLARSGNSGRSLAANASMVSRISAPRETSRWLDERVAPRRAVLAALLRGDPRRVTNREPDAREERREPVADRVLDVGAVAPDDVDLDAIGGGLVRLVQKEVADLGERAIEGARRHERAVGTHDRVLPAALDRAERRHGRVLAR